MASTDEIDIPAIHSTGSSSSSSLDYINSQLQSHGFIRRPLSVSALGSHEREQLAKCLFAMLQQRVDDLVSLEAVSTAHRTMAYDHERLAKMLKASRDDAVAAERKEQAARSQLIAAQTALKNEQESHRKTREEAAKARTALAFVRTQAQHDMKKRESDTARTLERWQKLSNDQARQQSARSGLSMVNYVDARGLALLRPLPEPSKFHQSAMDELEDARSRVVEENDAFRRVLLQLGQHLQSACVALESDQDAAVPDAITPSSLFDSTSPLFASSSQAGANTRAEHALTPSTTSHASAARSTILGLLSQLQAKVRAVRSSASLANDGHEGDELSAARDAAAEATIRDLEEELTRLQAQLEERQDFMENILTKSAAMHSTLDGVRAGVEEDDAAETGDALARQKEALEEERRRFTEAAVKLGKDRMEMEAERLQFLEEKRSLQMAALIADLPPTPDHPAASASSSRAYPSASPKPGHLTPSRRTYKRKSSPLARSALANAEAGPSGSSKPAAPPSAAPAGRSYLSGLGKENIGTPRKAQLGTGSRPSLLGASGAGGGGERRRSRLAGSPGKPRVARNSLSVRG